MAESFIFSGGSPISLDEYVEYVRGSVDLSDIGSLRDSAYNLYRLSLNKSILNDIILDEAYKNDEEVQPGNLYADQSFIIHTDNEFFIRANIWTPPKTGTWKTGGQTDFNYEIPHDHNYDFLTVGYFGPGYTTRIFEYDYDTCSDVVGDKVELRFLEETTLPVNKVMLYRQSKDVHTQLHPTSLSVSLNLMVSSKSVKTHQQLELDHNGVITGLVSPYQLRQANLIEICGLLGYDDLIEPIAQICSTSIQPMVLSQALLSLKSIDDDIARRSALLLGSIDSRLVQSTIKSILVR